MEVMKFLHDYEMALIDRIIDGMNSNEISIRECGEAVDVVSNTVETARELHLLGDDQAARLLIARLNTHLKTLAVVLRGSSSLSLMPSSEVRNTE